MTAPAFNFLWFRLESIENSKKKRNKIVQEIEDIFENNEIQDMEKK